mmetsp:Transcript_9211/g.8613  ORF Transcript_9211/g.8613 Transcript_9211/m.8613 type:complete len:192 (+) Transcript_9211:1493-2068(+)
MASHHQNEGEDLEQPLEVLREYLELGGWYSRMHPRFNYISQLSILAAFTLNEGSGELRPMNERLSRHFTKLYLPPLKSQEIHSIFKAHLLNHLDKKEDKDLIEASQPVLEVLSQFLFKNQESFLYNGKIYGFNLGIQSAINLIKRFAIFDWKDKTLAKFSQMWLDSIKTHFLSQFPVIFATGLEQQNFQRN